MVGGSRRWRWMRLSVFLMCSLGVMYWFTFVMYLRLSSLDSLLGSGYAEFKFVIGTTECGIRNYPFTKFRNHDTIEIIWETTCNEDNWINYGNYSNQLVYQKKATTYTIAQGHHVRSVVLEAYLDSPSRTHFFYAIRSPEFPTEHIYYVPFPRSQEDALPLKFGFISDSQSNAVVTRNLLKAMLQANPDLIIHAGDVVQSGYSLHDWQINWLSPLSLLSRPLQGTSLLQQTPLVISRGNHDISPYGDKYGVPFSYFAASLGGTRWVFLDSHQLFEEQVRFISKEVAGEEWRMAKFRVVVTHIPPFIEWWEKGAWFEKGEKHWGDAVRERFLPLLEGAGVDLVIGGHSHLYSRGWQRGVHYMVIGGGGGELEKERVEDFGIFKVHSLSYHFAILEVSARGCYLQWKVYDDQGTNIDTLKLLSKACSK